MEKTLLDGGGNMVAGLIVILALHLLLSIGKLAFEVVRKKGEISERAMDGVSRLETRMMAVERDLNEVLKLRHDFRKLFSAIKVIAGDKWPDIKKQIKEDDLNA